MHSQRLQRGRGRCAAVLPVEALAAGRAEFLPPVGRVRHGDERAAVEAPEASDDGRALRHGFRLLRMLPVVVLPAGRRAVALGPAPGSKMLPAHGADRFPLHGPPGALQAHEKDSLKQAVLSLWQRRAFTEAQTV